jgi:glyoxylase-like metal-dependent hydrolase (beta-lactamase superfamily II)
VRRAAFLLAILASIAAVVPSAQTVSSIQDGPILLDGVGSGDVKVVRVRGSVYALFGAGASIVVSIGDDGVLVVDTGSAGMTEKVLTVIRQLSKKEIRWIVNTTLDPDHIGGNEKLSLAGRTVNGNPAAIISHEKLPIRMVKLPTPVPVSARPLNTFFSESRDFFFNDDAVFVYHTPGHTDGDTIVHFRNSDVIAAGDTFATTTYPVIDASNGGSVQGFIDSLNRMLDLTVPKHLEEGGTYVVPGHGRISDEADVLEYHDMIVIVRDRIRDAIKKGMTLDQVKAARPTRDYDPRYGATSGPWTSDMFVDAIYRTLPGF